ncbi:MAG: hypothetical protein LBJ11_10955 [Oscillospiraceae bacterium]|nr:hypothetical protein [Oscillospiraceae bacterium]
MEKMLVGAGVGFRILLTLTAAVLFFSASSSFAWCTETEKIENSRITDGSATLYELTGQTSEAADYVSREIAVSNIGKERYLIRLGFQERTALAGWSDTYDTYYVHSWVQSDAYCFKALQEPAATARAVPTALPRDGKGRPCSALNENILLDFTDLITDPAALKDPAACLDRWYYNPGDGSFYFIGMVPPGSMRPSLIKGLVTVNFPGERYLQRTEYRLDVGIDAVTAKAASLTSETGWTLPKNSPVTKALTAILTTEAAD